jgi:hypothetical protein
MLAEWRWLVPRELTPLFLTTLGDWIFGAPDGSLHGLDMLEAQLERVADNAAQYNAQKASRAWLEDRLLLGWYEIAIGNGLVPSAAECIGWKVHPLLGGRIEKTNLQLFSMRVYQSLMAQLHQQLRERAARPK